ncbi:eukaryotic peptide chain release factor GTP-binding subunit ERF3A [Tanacetum coccineum]
MHFVVGEGCEIIELMQEINPKTGEPMKKKVLVAKNGAVLICRIQVTNMICVEKFSDFQKLGRFTLRSEGKIVRVVNSLKIKNEGKFHHLNNALLSHSCTGGKTIAIGKIEELCA